MDPNTPDSPLPDDEIDRRLGAAGLLDAPASPSAPAPPLTPAAPPVAPTPTASPDLSASTATGASLGGAAQSTTPIYTPPLTSAAAPDLGSADSTTQSSTPGYGGVAKQPAADNATIPGFEKFDPVAGANGQN